MPTDNKHLPAYPCTIMEGKDSTNDRRSVDCKGLTKRELIAAMCLQGLLASSTPRTVHMQGVVLLAVEHADALLTYLSNTEQ